MLLNTLLTFLITALTVLAAPKNPVCKRRVTNQQYPTSQGHPTIPGHSFPNGQPQPTSTCYTISGWHGGKGKPTTTTSTKTLRPTTITATRTATVTTTSTPVITTTATTTSTSTATTTVMPVTNTFTTTISLTTTQSTSTITTTTTTSVTTETETITTTATSTIPAPAGFTPVSDSSGYTSLNTGQRLRREALDTLENRGGSSPASRQWRDGRGPPTGQGVKCVTVVQSTSTVLTTTTKTKTATARPTTSTVTTTQTATTTTTIVPSPVTATATSTTTITTTSTSTFTTTATATSTTATTLTSTTTTSFLAACAPTNILGPQVSPNGMYVQGVGNSDPLGIQANVAAGSPYECCVLCITGDAVSNCQNSIYDADTGNCNVIGGNAAVCPNGVQGNSGYVLLTSSVSNRFDSNGPCGTLGPDPSV